MTESEVNAILGNPTSIDKAYYYNITVNGQDLELNVWINLSSASDLESGKINTYDDCTTAFKTPGNLVYIDENGENKYHWVNADGAYMTVTFDAEGNIKNYSGVC